MMGVFVQINEESRHGKRHPIGYVIQENGCWDFVGAINRQGYGSVSRKRKHIPAYRFTYEQAYGAIPPGLELDHLCRNPTCVRPDHLEPVTHRENVLRGKSSELRAIHCPVGHPYDAINTYTYKGRWRGCRICRTEAMRRYRRRRAGTGRQ